ncbi:MAG: alpha-L-glutamate ligase-like protein [Myxococcales bacterium]|nr:alpha-L-glutamate ligase-like protein [Myxococcales bacterium]
MFQALRDKGILGINRRNVDFTTRWNPRRLYPLVDNKLRTKAMCLEAGIPVPRLLGKAEHHFEIPKLLERIEALQDFVLKPARGAMGNGIVVIVGQDNGVFSRAGGRKVSAGDLQYHASGIISGLYALGGQADMAMVEERLIVHPELTQIVYDGVPDVRVIIYRGYPIMGMVRLPTHGSGGRANLHQGAIGAGIDLATGAMIFAIQRNRPVSMHPDTQAKLLGRVLPHFDRVLEIAVRAADHTGLGYLGADVVVDAALGPVILEMNARPGLSIQLCNRSGILPRVEAIDRLPDERPPFEERLEIVRELARTWRP